MVITGEGGVDFRVNLDVGGLDYGPESETHGGTTRTIVSDKDFSGVTEEGKETEGE